MASTSATLPPAQHQERQPGSEAAMTPKPEVIRAGYKGSGKLKGKVAIITGGDSGIGRAVAVHFAREGADVVLSYLDEHQDAAATKAMCEHEGARCIIHAGDVGDSAVCNKIVEEALRAFRRVDILVNNAAEQHDCDDLTKMDPAKIARTFRTNIYSYIYMARAVWPHLHRGAAIINTTSVNAYKGHPSLLDYTATKGAIVSFTRALHMQAMSQNLIRVNGVAPGPIWTPLIPATFPKEKVESFGTQTPMSRAAQPSEVAPAYVFLASEDASYIAGQVLHPNGGVVVNA